MARPRPCSGIGMTAMAVRWYCVTLASSSLRPVNRFAAASVGSCDALSWKTVSAPLGGGRRRAAPRRRGRCWRSAALGRWGRSATPSGRASAACGLPRRLRVRWGGRLGRSAPRWPRSLRHRGAAGTGAGRLGRARLIRRRHGMGRCPEWRRCGRPNPSSTCCAVVGLIWPERLAEGAATGRSVARSSARAMAWAGTRTARVCNPAPASSATGQLGWRGRTRVRGPGQNAAASWCAVWVAATWANAASAVG